jgi:hypothetical protein
MNGDESFHSTTRQFWEFTHVQPYTSIEAPLKQQPGIPLVVDADDAHEV